VTAADNATATALDQLRNADDTSSSDQRHFFLAAAQVHSHLAIAEAIREVATAIHETGMSGWSAEDARAQLGDPIQLGEPE
jgi:hypothetical protein